VVFPTPITPSMAIYISVYQVNCILNSLLAPFLVGNMVQILAVKHTSDPIPVQPSTVFNLINIQLDFPKSWAKL